MKFWKRRQPADFDPDAFHPVTAAGPPDQRSAFAAGVRQGQREERQRHHSHPVLGLLVALVALAGLALLALAVREGSFARGGKVLDQNLAAAAGEAQMAGGNAMARTGEAIHDAGAAMKPKPSGGGQ